MQVEEGDITELPFPEAHFDAAVSAHVIDHLKERKKAGLAEIRRVLKPGGRFLMVVWVPGWATVRDAGTFNGMWFAVLERAS